MSLQIWMPLTKDLSNIGVCNATITNNGATYNTSGKLGGSYYFNGSSDIRISMPPNMTSIRNTSVCAWIKSTGSVVALGGISNDGNYTKAMVTLFTSGWQFGGSSGYKYISGGSIANSGVWHHVACVVTDTNVTTYLDGTQVATKTFSEIGVASFDITSANFIEIGCDHPGSDERLTGYVNDFRVYDHAISVAEIKALSMGLVCHYKLDEPSAIDNLVRNSSYVVYNNYANSGCTATLVDTGNKYDNCKIYRLTYTPDASHLSNVQTALSSHGIMGFRRTFSANTKYCFWILWRPITHPDTVCGGTASNISGWTEIPTSKYNDEWNIVGQCRKGNVITDKTDNIFTSFKTPSATAGTPIIIEFCCPHLVSGYDYILPEYDYIGTEPAVCDSSGYRNHGTRNGTMLTSYTTPRHDMCTVFDGSTTYIDIVSEIFPVVLNGPFTISMWVYNTDTGDKSILFGNYDLTGGFFNIEKTINETVRFFWDASPDKTFSNSVLTSNAFTHLVITRGGNTVKSYINGILKDTSTTTLTGNIPTTANNFRIGSDGKTGATRFNGRISDFRIYSTTLNADNVLALYNVGASVADNGSMMAYQFKEE